MYCRECSIQNCLVGYLDYLWKNNHSSESSVVYKDIHLLFLNIAIQNGGNEGKKNEGWKEAEVCAFTS